jgi:hypothetical protein
MEFEDELKEVLAAREAAEEAREEAISPRCGISGEQWVRVYLSIFSETMPSPLIPTPGIVLLILSCPRLKYS